MEMIDHGHPHCHIHEVEMMDHVKRSIAASYTSLLSRIDSHIEDNRVHVSVEEKDTWNNKADKTQIRDLEMRLTEKADYCDVIELKEILAKIKAKVENTSENGSDDGSDYITENELNRILEETKESIIEDIVEKIQNGELDIDLPDMNDYYTKSEVYNKSEIDQKISQITTQPGSGSVSVSYLNLVPSDAQGKYQIGNIVINGVSTPVYQKDAKTSISVDGKTIVVDGVPYDIDTDTPTTTGIAADQIKFVQNPLLSTTGNDAYKIGDFIVADTTYPIYGKDVIVSTENSEQSAEPSNLVQFLTYPLIRISTWDSAGNYNNGEESEGGIKYIDVVEHNGVYYKCTVAHTTSEPGVGNGWEKFAIHDDAYINTLIAENAYVQSLTAKQIVVTSDATSSTEGEVPVAGMLNGTIIPTQLTGKTNTNGIRIFAGNIPSNGDVSDAPFTVDSNGKLKATNAEITGIITATDGSFTGTVTATQGTFSNCTIDNTCTIQGVAVPVAIIANAKDIIDLPQAPDGSIYNILVMTTGDLPSGNAVEVRCATYNVTNNLTTDAMFEYYSNEWHLDGQALPQNRHTFCQTVGVYTFIRKSGDWYAIFPY